MSNKSETPRYIQNGLNGIHTEKGECIALTYGDSRKENAELICKAVNSHNKLIEMLTLVLKEKYREAPTAINTDLELKAEQLILSLK